jgi:hypothetical protein
LQGLGVRVKSIARKAIKNVAPDFSLLLVSIRSRRLIERQVAELGLDGFARTISNLTEGRVAGGPFKGMLMDYEAFPVLSAPKFIGCYEKEIIDFVREAIALSPPLVLNVGTAEGYYAIGFALMLPQARVFAAETDPKALRATLRNAQLNGVGDRLSTVGVLHSGEIARYLTSPGSLIMMDCEGAEFDLLNPDKDPILQYTHVIVEVHNDRGNVSEILNRFRRSHEIHNADAKARTIDDLGGLADTVEAVDERRGAQSWLWMKAKCI